MNMHEPFTAGPLAINNAVKLIIKLTISMNDDRNHNVFSNRKRIANISELPYHRRKDGP